MKKAWLTVIPLAILIVALYNNCRGPVIGAAGTFGSGIRSPFSSVKTTGLSTETGSPIFTGAQSCALDVMNNSCAVLARCISGVSRLECVESASINPDFAKALGPITATYPDLTAVINAEKALEIACDLNMLSDCQKALSALTCTSSEVTSAYTPGAPDPYINIYKIVPRDSACLTLFPTGATPK